MRQNLGYVAEFFSMKFKCYQIGRWCFDMLRTKFVEKKTSFSYLYKAFSIPIHDSWHLYEKPIDFLLKIKLNSLLQIQLLEHHYGFLDMFIVHHLAIIVFSLASPYKNWKNDYKWVIFWYWKFHFCTKKRKHSLAYWKHFFRSPLISIWDVDSSSFVIRRFIFGGLSA